MSMYECIIFIVIPQFKLPGFSSRSHIPRMFRIVPVLLTIWNSFQSSTHDLPQTAESPNSFKSNNLGYRDLASP